MNDKALHTLEFDKIIAQLASFATSDDGRALCSSLRPSEDPAEVERLQTETADATARLLRKGSVSFGNARDVRGSLKRLAIGSSLSAAELLSIAGLCENAGAALKYGRREKEDDPRTA